MATPSAGQAARLDDAASASSSAAVELKRRAGSGADAMTSVCTATATETHADPPLEMLSDEDDLFPGLGGGGGDGDLSLLRLLTRLRFTGDGSPSNIDIVQLLAAAAGASSLGDEAADMMAAVSVLDAELAGMRHREGGRAGATQSTAGAEGQPGGQPPEKQAEVVTTRQAATRAAFTHALVWDSLSLGDAAGDAAFEALMEANR